MTPSRVKGKKPVARDGHTAVVLGSKMIIYGGDQHQNALGDVFEIDLPTLILQATSTTS